MVSSEDLLTQEYC